jgi:hypothetical protein
MSLHFLAFPRPRARGCGGGAPAFWAGVGQRRHTAVLLIPSGGGDHAAAAHHRCAGLVAVAARAWHAQASAMEGRELTILEY